MSTTVTTPTPATTFAPAVPDYTASPRYRAALENLTRLQLEEQRLDRILQSQLTLREEALKAKKSPVEQLLAGKTATEVRHQAHENDFAIKLIQRDLKLTREGVEAASRELTRVRSSARHEVVASSPDFLKHYRVVARRAALAWVAAIRAQGEMDRLNDELFSRELRGIGGLDYPLAPVPTGDPFSAQSHSATLLRALIEAELLDEVEDRELLAGLAVAPKPKPFVPEAPPKPKPKPKYGGLAKVLVAVGAAKRRDFASAEDNADWTAG
jgi:hypothetical protein